MTPEQSEIRARFVSGRRAEPTSGFTLVHEDGGLIGPPNIWLRSPPLARALEQLGGAVRFELSLGRRAHELAVLVVAVAQASEFELAVHAPAAEAAGLTEQQVAAVLAGRVPDGLTDEESLVHEVVSEIVAVRALSDALFSRACARLGERGLVELVTLIGYYDLVAVQLRVFGPGTGPDTPVV